MLKSILGRKEQEESVKEMGRLPPGQALTNRFPVLHYGPVPKFSPAAWDLRVFGEVEEEKRWTWDEFNKLPRGKLLMDIHCVTRWSKFDTEWEGVYLKTLVDEGFIKLKPSARHLLQHCEYGFTVNIPVDIALAENFLLATHFDGRPLEPDHGYPLRGVIGNIPGKGLATPYFWKGGKWLRGLEFRETDQLGFWEQAGYHNEADVWKEQRFSYD
ncbi:MAG: molybdopterin-dependent oxidoreductase [Chloroflexi bacterium]|nr:molybdopterin-dependent oxidoreductase [Chloroflexota bacterium]MBI5828899.1 molybdopterin-dependent oxidoreductase [Chloroflexota bacterium]